MPNTLRNGYRAILVIALAQFQVTGCNALSSFSSKKSKDKGAADNTNVQITAPLEFGAGLGLQGVPTGTFDLTCFTFQIPANACTLAASVNGDDNLDVGGVCPGFANVPFGCYVRRDGVVVATGQFEKDSSLIVGAGDLQFDVKVDLFDGLAYITNIRGSAVENLGDFNPLLRFQQGFDCRHCQSTARVMYGTDRYYPIY